MIDHFVAVVTERGNPHGLTEKEYAARIHEHRQRETDGLYPRRLRKSDPADGMPGWRRKHIAKALSVVAKCGPIDARGVGKRIGMHENTASDFLRVLFRDGKVTRTRERGDRAYFYEVAK